MDKSSTLKQIEDLEMYNPDIGFFFSIDMFDSNCIKRLVIDRYAARRAESFTAVDAGTIFTERSGRFAEICSLLSVDPKDTLLCYEEKKRPVFMAIGSEEVIRTNQKPDPCPLKLMVEKADQNNYLLEINLNLSETMKNLLNEFNILYDKKTIESRIKEAAECHHPASNTKFSECELYIKALTLFCYEFGFSAEQILRLAELSCCFEISSNHLRQLLQYVSILPEDSCEKLTETIINSAAVTEKEVLLTDMLYMVRIGNYDIKTEFNAVERVGRLLNVSVDSVFIIYDKIKETQL